MKKLLLSLILFCIGFVLRAQPALPNPGFEQIDASSSTKAHGWKNGGRDGICQTDSTIKRSGRFSMHLSVPQGDGGTFFHTEEIPFQINGLKKYRISCALKSQGLVGQTGIRVKVWDETGYQLAGNNAFTITGDQDWKDMNAEFYAAEEAQKIAVFGNLIGSGDVWIDDLRIEEIALDNQPVTSAVSAYLDEYFSIVKQAWIGRDATKITLLRQRANLLCGGNPGLSYCHGILQRYITYGLDFHSNFTTPAEWKAMNNQTGSQERGEAKHTFATGQLLNKQIAYIRVPGFLGFDNIQIQRAVDTLQNLIRHLESKSPKGWIIDLSDNGGGNSMAMLPGLGPLLGNGVCGSSVSANGRFRKLYYREGEVGWDNKAEFKSNSKSYHLKKENRPIAVIQGPGTVSSGEVVAIAFRGKKHSKSFGQPTAGATTRVDNFEMSDGAYLFLAAGYDADKNGVVFQGSVPPDVPATNTEEAIQKATNWILHDSSPSSIRK